MRCGNGPNGGPGNVFKAVFRKVGTPVSWRARFKLVHLTEVTSPPTNGLVPPVRGPATLTLTYQPMNEPDVRMLPGVIRDCKVFNRVLRCKEP
jgi:hypothetical protein